MGRKSDKAAKDASLEYVRRAQSVLRQWGELVAREGGNCEVAYTQDRHSQLNTALTQILAQAFEEHHRANALEERIAKLEGAAARKGKGK